MKKTVAAWIEQILEFPTKLEYLAYIESLKKGKPQKFKETSFEQLESGVVRITIRKQYNNNAFPDDEKEGEESVCLFKVKRKNQGSVWNTGKVC